MTQHDWQCSANADQYPNECDCGTTGPRNPALDAWPKDRAPTEAELHAWRLTVQTQGGPPHA